VTEQSVWRDADSYLTGPGFKRCRPENSKVFVRGEVSCVA
jgi:hypothetical protein